MRRKYVVYMVLLIISYVIVFNTGKAVSVDPGSKEDPLVTKSYVDEAIRNINIINNNNSSTDFRYKVVNLKTGSKIIGGEGCEIILRSGKAVAIDSENGGLQDMTEGIDVLGKESVPRYHLMIIPRNDGRGMLVTSDANFMVRGEYTIE